MNEYEKGLKRLRSAEEEVEELRKQEDSVIERIMHSEEKLSYINELNTLRKREAKVLQEVFAIVCGIVCVNSCLMNMK